MTDRKGADAPSRSHTSCHDPIDDDLRRRYLDAMGVQRWRRRAGCAPVPAPAALPAAQPARNRDAAARASEAAASTMDWEALADAVRACTKCALHATRTQTVFGVGKRRAQWMFVGEAPGADEDAQGEPFVGRAGQLLNAMLFAIGLKREEVYIANVLKCRPPGNRDPLPEEVEHCEPYLIRQIELIAPRLIVALGRHAAHSLLKTELPLARLRGQRLSYHGTPLIVTYHPAYLLRSPADKRKAWEDLCLAKAILGASP
jgi:DNA polymerase